MRSNSIILDRLTDRELTDLSSSMLLSLSIDEMRTVRKYFEGRGRSPSMMEMEIIAQTWSEHCIHKTMTGIIEYTELDEDGNILNKETIDNLLRETVFKATKELDRSYCLSVFKDNAGIIELDEEYGIAMKVETHNHPSAIEPYGGAATGIGGVIRDILGCGKGAKPVLNIDVFCFGPLDTPRQDVPEGVLHPRRIFKGVVKGVRDYGNRMGIPTSSGAILFDEDYIYNPLVYCGTVGVIPKKYISKEVVPGDLIVVIGGKTGRDGIHGATFSSIGLNEETDAACVQIGDPITEKKFTDVLLKIRDMGLYNAITDCGAGGFSSAIGEMGEDCGAKVTLEKAVLKYEGLAPWEIFLSESQERMILSVPGKNIDALKEMTDAEDVEMAVLGEFTDTGRLEVYYGEEKHADLEMEFIHDGVPRIKKKAVWQKKRETRFSPAKIYPGKVCPEEIYPEKILKKILTYPNISSKESVTRQYDHEVQGGSVVKPLAGVTQDAPQDGCVTKPVLDRPAGIAVGLGVNPLYGSMDTYCMALANCEEAARNVAASGGNISKAAFMDNFCWGDTGEEKILGDLVRASKGCYDASKMLGIPFVSGKDSLNNCYVLKAGQGTKKINIPGTLLITCVAPVDDVSVAVGSDFKSPGNSIYLVGDTYEEMGCSVFSEVSGMGCGSLPLLRPDISFITLEKVQTALEKRLLKSCHDLSEGGLAVCLSEMCFSSAGAGICIQDIKIAEDVSKDQIPLDSMAADLVKLFSESNSRFVVEVENGRETEFEKHMKGIPCYRIGVTLEEPVLKISGNNKTVLINTGIGTLKECWKSSIKW
ncbi:MAG: phosphoribosylformylglycinamidine synthase subunit PurL [Elusimicrobiota bacterium]